MYKKVKKESVTFESVIDENAIYICNRDIICNDGVFIQGSLVMVEAVPKFVSHLTDEQNLIICDFKSGCLNNCVSNFGAGAIVDKNDNITPDNFYDFFEVERKITSMWKHIIDKRGNPDSIFWNFKDIKFIKNKHKLIESFTLEEREKYKML